MDKQFKNRGVLKLQPHDHACLIYESEDEWRDNVIPFIIAGLKQGRNVFTGLITGVNNIFSIASGKRV